MAPARRKTPLIIEILKESNPRLLEIRFLRTNKSVFFARRKRFFPDNKNAFSRHKKRAFRFCKKRLETLKKCFSEAVHDLSSGFQWWGVFPSSREPLFDMFGALLVLFFHLTRCFRCNMGTSSGSILAAKFRTRTVTSDPALPSLLDQIWTRTKTPLKKYCGGQ